MEDKLPKLLTGFRKNYNTLHCLSNILEKWKNTFDKSGFVCAMFMDLSKDFDTKKQNLLITKSGAYGFLKDALSFIKSYLFNEKIARSLCVNSEFSTLKKIISGVLQWTYHCFLKISLNDLFLFVEKSDLSNYADDNTLYCSGINWQKVKQTIRRDFQIVTKSFYKNYMVLNSR